MLVALIAGTLIGLVSTSKIFAQRDISTDVQTDTSLTVFHPNQIPVMVGSSAIYRTIEDRAVARFTLKSTSALAVSKVRFLLLVTDKSGHVRFGQGWRFEPVISSTSVSSAESQLKYSLQKGDRAVLVPYESVTEAGTDKALLTDILDRLSSAGVIKLPGGFVKTVGHILDSGDFCADAQNAAGRACKCGLKSFSCSYSTQSYSFTCFTKQENPDACPEGPPEG